MIAALAAACAAGRGCSVLLMFGHRYARDEGLGNLFIGKVSGRDTFVTLIITALITVVLLGAQGVLALLVTMVAIYLLGWLLKRTLGGQTGDTLGAAIELGEVIFLFALL
jgi:adenosylcobinamide-GDP ribazoletransferase